MPQHNESASDPSGLSEGVQQSVKTDFEDGEIALQVIDPEMQGIAGDVMRSAGYPVLLWQRVRALEHRLRACEDRLQAAEAGLSKPGTLRGRFAAWLERLRTAWTVRQAELPRARAAQGKAE